MPEDCRRVGRYKSLYRAPSYVIIIWTYRWPSDCFGMVCCPPKAVVLVLVDGVGCPSGRLPPVAAAPVVCVRFPESWPRSNSCWWPSMGPESADPIVVNPVERETNLYYYYNSIYKTTKYYVTAMLPADPLWLHFFITYIHRHNSLYECRE